MKQALYQIIIIIIINWFISLEYACYIIYIGLEKASRKYHFQKQTASDCLSFPPANRLLESSFSFSVNSRIRLIDMFSYLSVLAIASINDCGNIFFLTLLFGKVLILVQLVNCCVGKQYISNGHVVSDTVEQFTNTGCNVLITISQSYESGLVYFSVIGIWQNSWPTYRKPLNNLYIHTPSSTKLSISSSKSQAISPLTSEKPRVGS
ncbi:hypothetical protein AGLY_010172 [Aphis glycines]|uniref:Uncharacterized protein n=1 Tax=Aphis glycines TaxID=307491 RepID=A0A6G0THH1_APHGL|nr:hypothetical protein AGLY_010172 [Aphis glycines]